MRTQCKLCESPTTMHPLGTERLRAISKNKRHVASIEYPSICVGCHQNERKRVRGQNKRFPLHKRINRLYTHEWIQVLEGTDYSCAACKKSVSNKNLTLDHVIQLGQGGHNLIANVQPLCDKCHAIKDNRRFKAPITLRKKIKKLWRRKKMLFRIIAGEMPIQILADLAVLVMFALMITR